MPLVVLFGAVIVVGTVAGFLSWARPIADPASPRAARPVARLVERDCAATTASPGWSGTA